MQLNWQECCQLKVDEKMSFGGGVVLLLPLRCHGRAGAGGWWRRAGARAGVEAGPVATGSAGPGSAG